MHATTRRLVQPVLLLCTLAAGCAPPALDAPPLPASGLHRVVASGPAADALVAAGATVVAEYEAFRVLDAGPHALQASQALADGKVELRNDFLRIHLNSGDVDTSLAPASRARRGPRVGAEGKALRLVQFTAPARPEWLARLEATGVRVVGHVPANAYLVYGDGPALERFGAYTFAASEVQYEGDYLPAQKLDRALAPSGPGSYAVQLVEDPAVNAATLALARARETKPGHVAAALGYVNVVVHADRAAAELLAARPDVVSVQPYVEPTLLDERQDVLLAGQMTGGLPNAPGYLPWLAARGFTQAQFDASAFGVDVTDSGIDDASTTPNHFGLYRLGDVNAASRVAYVRLFGTPNAGSTLEGCDGHGNINAHIIAGYSDRTSAPFVDAQGYRYGLGVAPFVRVGGSVIFDPGSFTFPDYEDLISSAWADGMRISSNSWGANTASYTSDSQRYDALVRDAAPVGSAAPLAGNQEMTIVFAAGNAGPGASTIGSPGTAKNVLAAGASENVRSLGGNDGCGLGDSAADQGLDVIFFSSRGPTADGRTRPDLVAPGTHITGGVAQTAGQRAEPPASATGQANACFNATGVCGGVGSMFFPSGQQWYTTSSGTSHSTPAISGAAALLRQRFLNESLPPPSPAMTKAFLMNAARYMTGVGANDNLYSNSQGMGLLDLGAAFDGTPRLLRDQEPADLFTGSGQARVFTGAVGDTSKPFRVTLAWTDAPGSTFGNAYVNNLDLTVEVGGQVYKGNVFSGSTSVPGGTADFRNNVESVFLPAGTSGPFTITVTSTAVSGDGVPGNASALDQDFALVASNSCGDTVPAVPTGVAAVATADNEITVSWTAGGAAAYRVFRATTAGGPYTEVANVAASPFVDGGRSGGQTYYYVVRAQQGCALSAASAEVSATATGSCLAPPVFAGLASADTAGSLTCGNTLAWSAASAVCGGVVTYDVFRSTTSGFTPGVANRIATGVTATTHLDSGDLVGGTAYYYVVRAVETSAGGAVDDGNAIERSATPAWVSLSFGDDFDGNRPGSPADWWSERVLVGSDLLQLIAGCHWQSPSTAYRFGQSAAACGGLYLNSTRNMLVLGGNGTGTANGFQIPSAGGATMRFRLWYSTESYWDGAYLSYSTTGSTGTFTQIQDAASASAPYIAQGGYDQSTSVGVRAWSGQATGANGSLKSVLVNLDALAGQTVWFAWTFFTDSSVVYEGVYLDDVEVDARSFSCSTTPVPPGAPVRFVITGLPAAVGAGQDVTVAITALDEFNQVATGYAGTATLSSSDAAAVLPAPVTFTAGAASATVNFHTLGSQSLTATDGWLTGTRTTVVQAGVPVGLRFVAPAAGAVVTAGNPIPAQVEVIDAFGNRTASTATISLAIGANPGNDALQGTTTATAASGLAVFTNAYLTHAAAGYTLAASSSGLAGATSNSFSVVAAFPSALAFTQGPAAAVAGDPLAPAPVVEVRDPYGNRVVSGSPFVAVTILTGPSGASLTGTVARSAVNGLATFDDLLVDRAGTYVLAASSGSLATATGEPFEASPAPPHRAVFVQQPQDVVAGVAFQPPPQVLLLDRFDNPALQATTTVSLALAANPAGGKLLGELSTAAVAGVATFGNVSIDKVGTPYALYAGASGLLGETSVGFSVLTGPAAGFAFSGPSVATAGVEVVYDVSAVDSGANPVTGYAGVATATSTDAAATLPASVTFGAGLAQGVHVTFWTSGTQTLTFADSAAAMTGSVTVTVVSGGPPGPPGAPGETGPAGPPGANGGCSSGGGGAASGLVLLALAWIRRRDGRRARR